MNHAVKPALLDRASTYLLALAVVVFAVGQYLAFKAPPDAQQGYLVRILYVHVGAAWVAYLAFFVAMLFAVLYLWKQHPAYDRLSSASAEIGLVFMLLTLFGGMMWARPTWGIFWTWEPRLTTSAILTAFYVGYFLLRHAIEDPEFRAKAAAAAAILGVVNIPINYMSVYWWRSIHQTATVDLINRKTHMDPEMLVAMLVNLLAINLFFVAFVRLKGRLAALEAAREERYEQ
ncbi:MAG TPA: cytochrome C assembly protein [Oceanithermus profundus]|uniref:Heme exporter protein C n=1 Tax=Oceanithermus profundus TaxID=187137 RepID=A0A7C4V552_9DEIN|nr:cytochrome C assembly protein [Oceanithermus profundus]